MKYLRTYEGKIKPPLYLGDIIDIGILTSGLYDKYYIVIESADNMNGYRTFDTPVETYKIGYGFTSYGGFEKPINLKYIDNNIVEYIVNEVTYIIENSVHEDKYIEKLKGVLDVWDKNDTFNYYIEKYRIRKEGEKFNM